MKHLKTFENYKYEDAVEYTIDRFEKGRDDILETSIKESEDYIKQIKEHFGEDKVIVIDCKEFGLEDLSDLRESDKIKYKDKIVIFDDYMKWFYYEKIEKAAKELVEEVNSKVILINNY